MEFRLLFLGEMFLQYYTHIDVCIKSMTQWCATRGERDVLFLPAYSMIPALSWSSKSSLLKFSDHIV